MQRKSPQVVVVSQKHQMMAYQPKIRCVIWRSPRLHVSHKTGPTGDTQELNAPSHCIANCGDAHCRFHASQVISIFRCFFRPTFHAKWPKPIFDDFNGFPPDSCRLSIDFEIDFLSFSISFSQLQSILIIFNQFQSVWLGQKRRNFRRRWNGHNFFVHKIVAFIKSTNACWKEGSETLAGVPLLAQNALDWFIFVHFEPCVLLAEAYVFTHVFMDSNSRNRHWNLPMSAAISIRSPENPCQYSILVTWTGCFAMVVIFLTLARKL